MVRSSTRGIAHEHSGTVVPHGRMEEPSMLGRTDSRSPVSRASTDNFLPPTPDYRQSVQAKNGSRKRGDESRVLYSSIHPHAAARNASDRADLCAPFPL
jgi:hypothetical protein